MKYPKPPLSLRQQVELLASRGLAFEDREEAEAFLGRVNYYRFSAYCLPFERERHSFRLGARFDQVRRLYELDRRLRVLVMEAIEPVEVAVRTAIAYRLSHRYGPFAHADPKNLKPSFSHAEWLRELHEEAGRSKETFVSHFKERYEEFPQLPIWTAVEIMSFGALSKLFGGMRNDDRRAIAEPYGAHHKVFGPWLHTVVYVRNLCAHHARLWNRRLAVAPPSPRDDDRWRTIGPESGRKISHVLFSLSVMNGKLSGGEAFSAAWRSRIEEVLSDDCGVPDFLDSLGLSKGWASHPLWIMPFPIAIKSHKRG